MIRSFVFGISTFCVSIVHVTNLYTCEKPCIKIPSLKEGALIPASQQEKFFADSFTIAAIASHLISDKNKVGITTQVTATNIALAWPPKIIPTQAGKIASSYHPERKEFKINQEHLKTHAPTEKTAVPLSPTPLSPALVLNQEPDTENTINELRVLAAINNLQTNGTLTTPSYEYKKQPSGPILGYIQWPPKLGVKKLDENASETDNPNSPKQERKLTPRTIIVYSEIEQLYPAYSYLVPIYKSYITGKREKNEPAQQIIRPIKKEFLRPQDGSKLLAHHEKEKIYIFNDPKNKIRIAITDGKNFNDKKPQLTYPLCYAQRVLDWHNNPKKALKDAKEKNEYAYTENIMQHNFAFAIDNHLPNLGLNTIWPHEKNGDQICILIPAAIISTETKKKKPTLKIEPYILTFTFSNQKNKEWLREQNGLAYDTDHVYHRCAVHLNHSSVTPYSSILKKAVHLAGWCKKNIQ